MPLLGIAFVVQAFTDTITANDWIYQARVIDMANIVLAIQTRELILKNWNRLKLNTRLEQSVSDVFKSKINR